MPIPQLCESKDCLQALPSWRGINKVKCFYVRKDYWLYLPKREALSPFNSPYLIKIITTCMKKLFVSLLTLLCFIGMNAAEQFVSFVKQPDAVSITNATISYSENDINSILGGEREVLRVSFGQFIIQ